MDKIILIGGAPTVGKSELAKHLSKDLNIPWISCDSVKEIMRKTVRKNDYPNLFYQPSFAAEKYMNSHTIQQIIRDQNKENTDVWKGVKALIDTDYTWKSFIVEGVAIIPNLVHRSYRENKKIKTIFLINNDKEWIRKVVFTRGLWADADKYPDSVKEKEVEWVIEFNEWLKKDAKKYNFPVHDMSYDISGRGINHDDLVKIGKLLKV